MAPNWLPKRHPLSGDIDRDTESLYVIFTRDFIAGRPTLEGMSVSWDKGRDYGSIYDRGFLHMITRDSEIAQERRFDDFRAERLPWCRPLLDNCTCTTVKKWDSKEGGRVNTYLWLENERYVLVLQRMKKDYFVLVTAHHVDGPSSARRLHSKYKNRISP